MFICMFLGVLLFVLLPIIPSARRYVIESFDISTREYGEIVSPFILFEIGINDDNKYGWGEIVFNMFMLAIMGGFYGFLSPLSVPITIITLTIRRYLIKKGNKKNVR